MRHHYLENEANGTQESLADADLDQVQFWLSAVVHSFSLQI